MYLCLCLYVCVVRHFVCVHFSGDPDYVLDEFMNVVQTHNVVPRVDQVLCFFIQKEDPENLQKGD